MVLTVKEHKTGIAGRAKLFLDSPNHCNMHAYATTLRPLLCPHSDVSQLLVLPGGRPITHINNLLQSLGRKYAMKVLTATCLSKIGATVAVKQVCMRHQCSPGVSC